MSAVAYPISPVACFSYFGFTLTWFPVLQIVYGMRLRDTASVCPVAVGLTLTLPRPQIAPAAAQLGLQAEEVNARKSEWRTISRMFASEDVRRRVRESSIATAARRCSCVVNSVASALRTVLPTASRAKAHGRRQGRRPPRLTQQPCAGVAAHNAHRRLHGYLSWRACAAPSSSTTLDLCTVRTHPTKCVRVTRTFRRGHSNVHVWVQPAARHVHTVRVVQLREHRELARAMLAALEGEEDQQKADQDEAANAGAEIRALAALIKRLRERLHKWSEVRLHALRVDVSLSTHWLRDRRWVHWVGLWVDDGIRHRHRNLFHGRLARQWVLWVLLRIGIHVSWRIKGGGCGLGRCRRRRRGNRLLTECLHLCSRTVCSRHLLGQRRVIAQRCVRTWLVAALFCWARLA